MFGVLLTADSIGLGSKVKFDTTVAYEKFLLQKQHDTAILARPSLRAVTFLAIVFSTFAITACLFTFPLLFHYVQQLQANAQGEVQFCKLRTRDIWREMMDVDDVAESEIIYRPKRRAADNGICCTCQQGLPGPDGPPGGPGKDGAPGEPSTEDGKPGTDAELHDRILNVPPQCPCQAPSGPPGPPGVPGNDGQAGSPGKNGEDGLSGTPGPPGPDGPPGQPGQPGQRGSPGEPGTLIPSTQLEPGPPGAAGRPGSPGPSGRPGQPGKDGDSGATGPAGEPGQRGPPGPNGPPGPVGRKGEPGAPGTCEHCPPARLAPGY